MELPKIMIGMMLKNSARFLPTVLNEIVKLDYPKDKLRLVGIYGKSIDNTLEIMKDFKKKNIIKTEVYQEQPDQFLRMLKQYGAATVWNDMKRSMNDNEDYFLLIDSDLVKLPTNLIKELLKVDADIVAPYPWVENKHFFDSWGFRINNIRFSPKDPPGKGLKYPIEVDNVGTCFLANRETWISVPVNNPHPYLTFHSNARKYGYQIAALPYLEVFHADLEKLGIYHLPPDPKYGGYPSTMDFLDSSYPVKKYTRRTHKSLKQLMEKEVKKVNKLIEEESIRKYSTSPIFRKKGKVWSYNKVHYDTFWMTGNPYLINLLHKAAPYPSYIEIEVTTRCNFKCRECVPENTTILGIEPNIIQEYDVGDNILGSDGIKTLITKTFKREYKGNVIRIKANGILPFSVTPEHPIYVSKKRFIDKKPVFRGNTWSPPEFIPASQLDKSFSLVLPKLKEYREWNVDIDYSNELMELSGIYLAEGSCTQTKPLPHGNQKSDRYNIITFNFGKHEKELINRTKHLVKEVFDKYPTVSEGKTAMNVSLYSFIAQEYFSSFGHGAINKKIPGFIMYLDNKEGIKRFLDGYIRGDGYIYDDYAQFTTSSKGLIIQLQKLLTKLNIFGRLYENKREGSSIICGRKVKIHNLYNLYVTSSDFILFTTGNKPKSKRYYYEDDNNFYISIKKVHPIHYDGYVYNFETLDDTYELHNVVVHNCEHSHWDEPNRDMTLDQFKYIVDQFPDLKWIGLTGIGESFLNKGFIQMLEYVKSKDIFVEMYDTFFFIDEKLARKLIELGIDRIFASIDAASKETYESIRVGSNYNRIWKNVKRFSDLKKEMGCTHYPELCFHYITFKDNIHEVEDYLQLIHDLDIDVHFVQYARLLHKYKEVEDLFIEIPEKTQRDILRKGKELGINILWNANLPKNKPPIHTCTAWFMPFIFVTGDVQVCCMPKGSYIYGSNTSIEKLRIGDDVLSSTGKEEKVTNIFKRLYDGDLITIKGRGLLSSSFTEEHPIRIIHPRRCGSNNCYRIKDNCSDCIKKPTSAMWMLSKYVSSGDYLLIPRRKDSRDNMIKINGEERLLSKDIAWLLGLYLAEGYTNRNNIFYTLGITENHLANRIKRICKRYHIKVSIKEYRKRSVLVVRFADKYLAEYLRINFLKRAYIKQVPEDIKSSSIPIIKSFLEGYAEGDGYKDGPYWRITTSSKKCALDIQELGFKIGVFISIRKGREKGKMTILGRIVNAHGTYILYLNAKDFYGKRKRQFNVKFDDDYFYVPIKERQMKTVKDLEVFNIETEDHTFSVPFLVHNCATNERNDREWQRSTSLGNILKTPFKDIWNNRKYIKMRKLLKQGICPKECRDCPVYSV